MSRRATVVQRVFLLLVLVATVGFTAPPQPPLVMANGEALQPVPQLRTVRFGSPQALSDAGVFIGRERGYFRDLGLDVELVPFQSGPNTIPALASGDLETAGGTISVALLNALERGIQIKMVADKGTSRPNFEFVQVPVRRSLLDSGEVRSVPDLRGGSLSRLSRVVPSL
jgi:ABC-type nitrate/sulfonate/bicarbonate transport system substrate-binding protein